jgi:hypothetical protein
MGSSLSGKDTTKQKTQVPPYIEDATKAALGAAGKLGSIGYVPYQGPTVAAFTPTQVAAMQNRNQGANAFGMNTAPVMAGMPKPQEFAGGVMGYSGMPLYKEAMRDWKSSAPGQYKQYMDMFMNKKTGKGGFYEDYKKYLSKDYANRQKAQKKNANKKPGDPEYIDRVWTPPF